MWVWVSLMTFVLILFAVESCQLQKERQCRVPMEHPGFLTPKECKAIIKAAMRKGLTRSEVVGKAGGEVSNVRTSSQVFIKHDDPAAEPIVAKVEKLLGCSRKHFEEVQVVRYKPGQKYGAHYDSDADTPRDEMRTDTVLMYLNEPKAGGNTAFPKAGVEVSPQRGKAVHWKNLDSHGNVLPCAYHAGTPVIKGTKWICTVWKRL